MDAIVIVILVIMVVAVLVVMWFMFQKSGLPQFGDLFKGLADAFGGMVNFGSDIVKGAGDVLTKTGIVIGQGVDWFTGGVNWFVGGAAKTAAWGRNSVQGGIAGIGKFGASLNPANWALGAGLGGGAQTVAAHLKTKNTSVVAVPQKKFDPVERSPHVRVYQKRTRT